MLLGLPNTLASFLFMPAICQIHIAMKLHIELGLWQLGGSESASSPEALLCWGHDQQSLQRLLFIFPVI